MTTSDQETQANKTPNAQPVIAVDPNDPLLPASSYCGIRQMIKDAHSIKSNLVIRVRCKHCLDMPKELRCFHIKFDMPGA
jgi:hypothetical protein